MTPTPSTPPTLRVQIELGFVRGCAACETIANTYAAAAVSDTQVTSFRAMPGGKHACGAVAQSGAAAPARALTGASTGPLEGQEALFPEPSRTYEQ